MSEIKLIHVADITNVDKAAREFLTHCTGRFFFGFYGGLGAGKTTFIQALCRELGSTDIATSPTFSIVNEYHTQPGSAGKAFKIYHIDFYRLKNLDEALNLGVQEYFSEADAYSFVEWPQVAEPIFPDDAVRVYMEKNDDNSRTIRIQL